VTEQNRLVREEDLIEDGYLRKGGYLVKQRGDREMRFIAVAHGLYDYDGIRPIKNEPDHDVLFQGVLFE